MKITSEKAPSELLQEEAAKDVPLSLLIKLLSDCSARYRDKYQLCPWREETMQGCSEKKSDTPFCGSVRGR